MRGYEGRINVILGLRNGVIPMVSCVADISGINGFPGTESPVRLSSDTNVVSVQKVLEEGRSLIII